VAMGSWLTFRGPAHDIDCLGMFREGGNVIDGSLVAFLLYLPQLHIGVSSNPRGGSDGDGARGWKTYPNIVVSGTRCQAALAIGFEVGRVDGVRIIVVVVPVYDQRSRLHFEDETVAPPLSWRCVDEAPNPQSTAANSTEARVCR